MSYGSRDLLIPRLIELYHRMDAAYAALAGETGFSCHGCDGATCCTVDLMLHTLVERLYLRRGFTSLDPDAQTRITARADEMVRHKDLNPSGEPYRSMVCVLNERGLCILYQFRPMICRLAGISHSFVRPDGHRIRGNGCPVFERDVHPTHPNVQLDRTLLYQDMAEIETATLRTLRRARPRPCTLSELFAHGRVSVPDFPPDASSQYPAM